MFRVYCENTVYGEPETEEKAKIMVDYLEEIGYNAFYINLTED